jgi:hypothetical protein
MRPRMTRYLPVVRLFAWLTPSGRHPLGYRRAPPAPGNASPVAAPRLDIHVTATEEACWQAQRLAVELSGNEWPATPGNRHNARMALREAAKAVLG